MVYWASDPDTIAHGAMRRWFYQVAPDNPHLARARAAHAALIGQPMPEREGDPAQRDPAQWAAALAEFATTSDVEPVTGPMTTKVASIPPAIACGFGVDYFCRHRRVCEDACPPEAISADKRMERGTETRCDQPQLLLFMEQVLKPSIA